MSWRVLLVEDDDDIRETLASMLAARGLHVVEACHGRDALDKVHRHGNRPSVVILDLMMPVMDGETFLREQAEDPLLAHVPVIILTAQLWRPEPLPPNVRAVLMKPFDLPALLAVVQQVWDDRPIVPMPTIAKGTGGVPADMLLVQQSPEPAPEETPPPPPERAASQRPDSEP